MSAKSAQLFGSYVVESVDGAATSAHATIQFRAGESGKVAVNAHVANTIAGELKDENHKLFGFCISTMMMGSDAEMKIENTLSQGFGDGMAYAVKDGKVTLTHGSHTLVLKAA